MPAEVPDHPLPAPDPVAPATGRSAHPGTTGVPFPPEDPLVHLRKHHWITAVLAAFALVIFASTPAAAAVTVVDGIVQEPDEYEARFPDVIKLDDGRLMAVWHRAAEHSGTPGTVRLSFGSADGRTWTTPTPALANPDTMAGLDTRDPKLGKMNDGAVVLTFFVPGGKLYYSVWKPGWSRFTDPERLPAPGSSAGMYSHGGALAVTDDGAQVDQVLIPYYTIGTSGGAHFLRATWRATLAPRLLVTGTHKIISNDNPPGRTYTEPSFIQSGRTVVTVIRSEQDGLGSPAVIAKWDAYAATPAYAFQSFTGVSASSHHLLKTAAGDVLFTYGDRARTGRPTVGMLIRDPAATWVKGTVVPIYNTGAGDQANPSSAEITPGTYLTLGYDARAKTVSPTGGTLWTIESHTDDY